MKFSVYVCLLLMTIQVYGGVQLKNRNGESVVIGKKEHKKQEEIKKDVTKFFEKQGVRFDEIEKKLDILAEKKRKNVAKELNPIIAGVGERKGADKREHLTEEELNAINGVADNFLEGDILPTEEQIDEELAAMDDQSGEHDRRKRKMFSPNSAKWPSTRIAYVLDSSSLNSNKISQIRNSLQFWEDNTCLSFYESSSANNRIKFFNGTGCYSSLGFVGGEQGLSIGDGCEQFGTVTHEIGHALGFWHEQSRIDRNNSIIVNYNEIESISHNQYDAAGSSEQILYADYEYGSVMHYGVSGFALGNRPTIIARDENYQETMGNRIAPTFLDIFTMNSHYCSGSCTSNSCKNSGIPNPNKCSSCICPYGFGGYDCSSSDSGAGCGGDRYAEEHWKTMTVDQDGNEQNCFWHILAPSSDKKVQIKLVRLKAVCQEGCYDGVLEMKPFTDFTQTGYRQCCGDSANIDRIYTGGNMVPIAAFSRSSVFFQIQYRYVNSNGGSDSTDSTTALPTGCYDVNSGGMCSLLKGGGKSKYCYNGYTMPAGSCIPASEYPNMISTIGCKVEEICRKSCGGCSSAVTEQPSKPVGWGNGDGVTDDDDGKTTTTAAAATTTTTETPCTANLDKYNFCIPYSIAGTNNWVCDAKYTMASINMAHICKNYGLDKTCTPRDLCCVDCANFF